MKVRRGDLLLFAQNAVLDVVFLPALLSPDSRLPIITVLAYVAMVTTGTCGYLLNRQYLPASAAGTGAFMWLAMLAKSVA